jgi:hypothetical protein
LKKPRDKSKTHVGDTIDCTVVAEISGTTIPIAVGDSVSDRAGKMNDFDERISTAEFFSQRMQDICDNIRISKNWNFKHP